MLNFVTARTLFCLLRLGVLLAAFGCSFAGEVDLTALASKYGQRVITQFDLPTSVIDKFNHFKATPPQKGASVIENVLTSDTEDWTSSPVSVDPNQGPYTVVVTLFAVAKTNAPATSMWQAGFGGDEGPNIRSLIAGLSKSNAKAGEQMILTAASSPVRFKTAHSAAATVALTRATNMEIKAVHVAVVGGIGSASWIDWLLNMRMALVGVIMFVLWWFWFRVR